MTETAIAYITRIGDLMRIFQYANGAVTKRLEPGTCTVCGHDSAAAIEVWRRPYVCSCSDASRPTSNDPCREADVETLCPDCHLEYTRILAMAVHQPTVSTLTGRTNP